MEKIIRQLTEEGLRAGRGSNDFSCSGIDLTLAAGALYEGTFTVCGSEDSVFSGYITTTDRRMECLTPTFSGYEETIAYRFNAMYLEDGDDVEGNFCVVSSHGEYLLPYHIHIVGTTVMSSQGEIRNLTDFTALARSNWAEAVRLYYTPEFAKLIHKLEKSGLSGIEEIYSGLSVRPQDQQYVEEFLIASGQKSPVVFNVREESFDINDPSEDVSFILNVDRSGWGYTSICVRVEGDFIHTENDVLTDEDFLGNCCEVPVYIDNEHLHQGNNFGLVRFENTFHTVEVPVNVMSGGGIFYRIRLQRGNIIKELMDSYQDRQLEKISQSQWQETSGELVEHLVAMDSKDVEGRLFQAQYLISTKRVHEGSWMLTHSEQLMEREESATPELRSYYLYLTTLINKDSDYIDSTRETVEDILKKNRSSWQVAWILLRLSPVYEDNPEQKWEFLERQFQRGCTSPIWYLEALQMLLKNPAMLRKLGAFELQVIWYGCRKDALSAELAEQFLYLAGRVRDYSQILLKILIKCYEKFDNDTRFLQEICSLLIKGRRTDKRAFVWYEAGVEAQLRLTRLYEYYMMSMDLSAPAEISRNAILYFAWQSDLDSEHCAYLYGYVLRHEDELGEEAVQYRGKMESFVVDQVLKGNISEDLAFLYQKLITADMIENGPYTSGDDWSAREAGDFCQALSRLFFTYRLTVENKNLTTVIVFRPDMVQPSRYVINGGSVILPLYGEGNMVFLEDNSGARYLARGYLKDNSERGDICGIKKLMDPDPVLEKMACSVTADRADTALSVYLWKRGCDEEMCADLALRGKYLLEGNEICADLKREIQMRLLDCYCEWGNVEALCEELDNVNWEILDESSRVKVMNMLVDSGFIVKTHDWLEIFGPHGMRVESLIHFLCQSIRDEDYSEDAVLVEAASYLDRLGELGNNPNEDKGQVLAYLSEYFQGQMEEMERIRLEMNLYELDGRNFCARMLEQMLFTGVYPDSREEVLKTCLLSEDAGDLISAFTEAYCYDYLSEKCVSSESEASVVFNEVIRLYESGVKLNDVEKAAFLKYYADCLQGRDLSDDGESDANVKIAAGDFLSEMMRRGIHLDYFKKLTDFKELIRPLDDKTIITVHADSCTRVSLYCAILQEGESDAHMHREDMKSGPGGLYYKEFVLFFGERLIYYFVRESDRLKEVTHSMELCADVKESSGSFGMINEIMESASVKDYEAMDDQLEDYCHREYLGNRLFDIL